MQGLHRILVAVDFSESSRAAAEYAALLGERLGAEVDVLHVWRPSESASSRAEILAEFARSAEGDKMRDLLQAIERIGHSEAHGRIAPSGGDVPDAILQVAASEEYDLVVVGMHWKEGLARMLKDGVAETIMRRSPCPVVTVPPAEFQAAEAPGSAEKTPLPEQDDPRSWVS